MNKFYLLILFLTIITISSKAQKDTEFWFVAPEAAKTEDFLLDTPIVFRVITYEEEATLTFSQPAGAGMPDITTTIPPHTLETIELGPWLEFIENIPANTVLNRGIYIESSTPVTIYYELVTGVGIGAPQQFNPETVVLKGKNALGRKFTIPGQTILENDIYRHSPDPYAAFDIVATEDNTTVTITPAHDIVGHSAASTFTVTLDAAQTYSGAATSHIAGVHLNGSLVTSDKPIAITYKDDMILGNAPYTGGCADMGADQLVPDDLLGNEYIAVNGNLNGPGSYLFASAIEDGTQVFKDGALIGSIGAGETLDFILGGDATYITSNHPITLLQLNGIGCEMGFAQLPQLYCTGSDDVSFVRSSNVELVINILIRDGAQGNFTLNGSATAISASDFSDVPGTGGSWVYTKLEYDGTDFPIGTVINIKNSEDLFHAGVMEGFAQDGSSYGYFSNYGSIASIVDVEPNPACAGADIQLTAHYREGATYTWSGPEGFTSDIHNPIINNVMPSQTGWYYCTISNLHCTGIDSVYIEIIPGAELNIIPSDTSFCEGNSVTLRVETDLDIFWEPAELVSNPTGKEITVFPTETTTFYVSTNEESGCNATDSITLTKSPNPELNVWADDSTVACSKDFTQLHVEGATTYTWSPDLYIDNIHSSNPIVRPLESTLYVVQGISEQGCVSYDSIWIAYNEEGYYMMPNAFSPNADGLNDIYHPKLYCIFKMHSFSIFNRFGEQVFISFDENEGWDGYFNGKACDLGVYFWIIIGEDRFGNPVTKKGDVSLIR